MRTTEIVPWDSVRRVLTRGSKKQARKQADDVAYVAERARNSIVCTHLLQNLAIDNSQHKVTLHSDESVSLHTASNIHIMFSTKAVTLRALTRAPCQTRCKVRCPTAKRMYATEHEQRTQETLKTSLRLTW